MPLSAVPHGDVGGGFAPRQGKAASHVNLTPACYGDSVDLTINPSPERRPHVGSRTERNDVRCMDPTSAGENTSNDVAIFRESNCANRPAHTREGELRIPVRNRLCTRISRAGEQDEGHSQGYHRSFRY